MKETSSNKESNVVTERRIKQLLSPSRIAVPIVLSILLIGVILYYKFEKIAEGLSQFNFTAYTFFWIFIAIVAVVLRHLGYMWRLKVLSSNSISLKEAFQVMSIWELASTITPSSVGGTIVAPLILFKEKISGGKSTAIVMASLLLDNLFFIFSILIFTIIYGTQFLVIESKTGPTYLGQLGNYMFLIALAFLLLNATFIIYGLFVNPMVFKRIINWFSGISLLKRFNQKIEGFGNDVFIASKELGKANFGFWAGAFGATCFAWVFRFLVGTFLVIAFTSESVDHLSNFSRQISIWMVAGITPTPGATGIMTVFTDFFKDFTGSGLAELVAFLWRFFTYFIYIILGLIVLPRWIKRVF